MESQNLDETRPSTIKPDETPPPESPANAEAILKEQPLQPKAEEDVETTPAAEGTQPALSPAELELEALEPDVVEPNAEEPTPQKRKRLGWILWAALGLFLLALIAVGSGFGGYRSAIDERTTYAATRIAGDAKVQYDLAILDMQAGNYELARQRFEYVIQLDPNYPGAADNLAAVLLELRTTATPTLAPTPTLTPTPDLRGRDDLYLQAQQLLAGNDWTTAIDTLLTLRKKYPDFQAVEVDGMLYVALRNRGVDKIVSSDLEGGTYDLTLAERFGPLDAEAKNWRDWAEMYIRGASYWSVDWAQAVYHFSQLASTVPNLSDASGWTASNRYLDALLGYGDWLSGRGEWCTAAEQYALYLSLLANPQVEPTAVHADEQCASGGDSGGGGEGGDDGQPTQEATPTPPGQEPALPPTLEPTNTPQPQSTPYP
ncbi:MAG: tetratricopeptide repeat protein [Anaerolineales bacterium]|nr:tetratricopeptide repeat protein [Anaerolineales bacterium]